nr:hypothetical protein [uncultured Blautia sp.]
MANTNWNTRIVLCNDTTVNWGTSDKVLLKGEMALEFTDSEVKIKIGDGVNTFAQLEYATMTPKEIKSALDDAIQKASHTHNNKAILDAITVAFTTQLKTNYDEAYTHSQAAHAPSNAERNIITGIKKNGVAVDVGEDRTVDIKVPIKVSELTNDSGFVNKDTKYTLETPVSAENGTAVITLKGNDSTSDSVTIKGVGATTVTTDVSGNIVVTSEDTVYTHPTSGVSTGSYTKVTVDANGHVTKGENPNTLAGYGIIDAIQKGTKFGNADITDLDAGKLTGTIDIARLPHGALERCKVVADDTARFKLTKTDVQIGDTVKVTATGKMYFVVDDTQLSAETGYEVYTAGSATSVPWSGITDKPSTFTPSAHNHPMTDVNGLESALAGKATSEQGVKADTAVQSIKLGGVEKKVGTTVELPAYPTTLPASDVSAWAKASVKPTYTKAEVGLGNVTNARQIAGLSTGTTADHVVAFGADGYTVKDTGFTIAKSVPSNAKFTDTTYTVANASTAGLVKSATGANKVTVNTDGTMNVGSVSTDTIANGANVLILNGGGAE